MSITVAPARYVRVPLAAALTGLTVEAIESKIEKGIWIEGKEYIRKFTSSTAKRPEIYIDMKGYERWVETETVASS